MIDHRKLPRGPRKPAPRVDTLPDSAYVRRDQILRDVLPIGPVTLWRWVREKKFPAPDRINGMPFWPVGRIRDWQRRQSEREAA